MINHDAVVRLLQTAAAYDGRKASEGSVHAWAAAAEAAGWTYPLAYRALVEHYTTSTDWIMPGHITQRITQARRAVYAAFQIPPHSPELADDGPAFVAWAKARAAEHIAAGLAEWASVGHLPAPLELEA